MILSTLRRYIESTGGKLDHVAKFPDGATMRYSALDYRFVTMT